MDLHTAFDDGFDRVEERAEVVRVVTRNRLGEHFAGADIERGDELGDAVTLVLELSASGSTVASMVSRNAQKLSESLRGIVSAST